MCFKQLGLLAYTSYSHAFFLIAGDKVAFAKFTENLNEFVQGDRYGNVQFIFLKLMKKD